MSLFIIPICKKRLNLRLEKSFQIKIIDRKKDLVKLQHGEYISLGKIEAELKSCSLIDNVCMYADPTQTFAVALLTPNADQLKSLADKSKFIVMTLRRAGCFCFAFFI